MAGQDEPAAPRASSPELCTAMKVRRLARRVTQIYDDALAGHGLTIGQLGLLAVLGRRRGLGVNALAERLGADASTISRLIRPLEAAGLLHIAPDPDDGRAKVVTITDAGYARRAAAITAWEAAQADVARRLGPSRHAALHFLLDDAHAHL